MSYSPRSRKDSEGLRWLQSLKAAPDTQSSGDCERELLERFILAEVIPNKWHLLRAEGKQLTVEQC
jgi:hypothetical protein